MLTDINEVPLNRYLWDLRDIKEGRTGANQLKCDSCGKWVDKLVKVDNFNICLGCKEDADA